MEDFKNMRVGRFGIMGAIRLINFKEIDPAECALCCSSIKKCPVNRKFINHEIFNKIKKESLATSAQ